MSNSLNKKLIEIMGKMDDRVLQMKLNAALDMLRKGNTEELARKVNRMDMDELVTNVNEFDAAKLKELNINKEEIREKVTETDFRKLASLLGERGDEIVGKLRSLLK